MAVVTVDDIVVLIVLLCEKEALVDCVTLPDVDAEVEIEVLTDSDALDDPLVEAVDDADVVCVVRTSHTEPKVP